MSDSLNFPPPIAIDAELATARIYLGRAWCLAFENWQKDRTPDAKSAMIDIENAEYAVRTARNKINR